MSNQVRRTEAGEAMPGNPEAQGRREAAYGAKLVGVLFLLGAFIGVPGLISALEDRQLVSGGTQAVGTVTDVDIKYSRGRGAAYKTVEFTANDSKNYTAAGHQKYSTRYDGEESEFIEGLVGNTNAVFYDPEDPDKNVVAGSVDSLAVPVFFILMLGGLGSWLFFSVSKKIGSSQVSASIEADGPK